MDTNKAEIIHKDLSYKIVGLAMEVYNELGCGFLEKVYENAMMIALREAGIQAEQQKNISVYFHNHVVGEYCGDIVVENKILLELKSVEYLITAHRSQILNYLKATQLQLGLLINFGKKLEYERFVF
ncbi:MAG: GxxExxY protein [Sedimentisphaerales bacterium]|nr:GxxExxY protein [Sedimentisphaerales bacterium]